VLSKPGQSINFLKKGTKDEIQPIKKILVRSKSETKRSNFKCPSNPEKFKIPTNVDCKIVYEEINKKTIIQKGEERFILNNCKFKEDSTQRN